MNSIRRRLLCLAAAAIAAPSPAWAQAYPAHPVRAIVPFPPGGATDIVARPIVQELSKRLGQPFIVENVPGASGDIGTAKAAKAAPDGYTLLFAYSSHVVNLSLFDKVPYDPVRDFAPITLAAASPAVLSVHPAFPARTLDELIALIKANPGKYTYASGGTGTQPHLAAEQLRLSLGLDLAHVPYNGGGPALVSMIAGHTPIGFTTLPPTVPHIKSGKLRALAIAGAKRSQSVPDVPTMAQAGYPGVEGDTWVGVFAPAGTDKQLVALLNREIVGILSQSTMRERLMNLGYEPVGDSPDEFAARITAEIAKWAKIIRSGGIKAQ
ncbi:MAG TPA: tripartite tricarboxylate transporter substrate binding protein [Burkholderiales bacterium]|jgi:tripartite-type tricarboxylate transporter receptor subunit TctC